MAEILTNTIQFLWGLVPVIVLLGFLIFVHELGHYLAARSVGVRVEVFSLGFGPRLFGVIRGGTDYRISAIPFGGYVKMAGGDLAHDQDGEASESGDLPGRSTDTPRVFQDDELPAKSIPARGLVYIAGATMNAIVAVVITAGLAYTGIYVSATSRQPPRIGWIAPDSPAEKAGFNAGETILKVDGQPVKTWDDASFALFLDPDKPKSITVEEDGAETTRELPPVEPEKFPRGGLIPAQRILVGSVTPDSPADTAGLKADDEITAVNNAPINSPHEFQSIILQSDGKPITVEIRRNGTSITRSVTAGYNTDLKRYLIGITFAEDRTLTRYPLPEAIKAGFTINYEMGKTMLKLLAELVTGRASPKNLSGPIMIGVLAKKASDQGIRSLLNLTAIISLNLAILNVLPIPILDGGLILFLLIEWIRRKPLSEKMLIVIQNVFFFLLISLAIMVTYNDILNIPKFFP